VSATLAGNVVARAGARAAASQRRREQVCRRSSSAEVNAYQDNDSDDDGDKHKRGKGTRIIHCRILANSDEKPIKFQRYSLV
jgi:hypothetical protein